MNVAARLEQAAGEREVLLGELTYRLVRDSVEVEEVEPLELKGKSEPVPAYQLVRVKETGDVEPRGRIPLIGRADELAIARVDLRGRRHDEVGPARDDSSPTQESGSRG